ncbi:MAG: TIGR03013 family XrtA/PEP-CTERM system glycosyltransferase [Nitrospirota bacterium]
MPSRLSSLSFKRIGYSLVENLLILFSVFLAMAIRFSFSADQVLEYEFVFFKSLLIAFVCQFSFYYNDLYAIHFESRWRDWLLSFAQSLAASSIILAVLYYLFPSLIIGRGIFLLTIILLPAVLIPWRFIYFRLLRIKPMQENILIIGSGQMARIMGELVYTEHKDKYNILGFLDEDPARIGERVINPGIIGTYDGLSKIMEAHPVNRIIVAIQDRRGKLPVADLLRYKFQGVTIEESETFYERLAGKILVENIKPSWFIFSSGFRGFKFLKLIKRAMDILLSTAALLVTWPLFLLIATAIKLESFGPVFFRQERVGENEKVFVLLKFRSMCNDAESETGPLWASKDDSRITRVGNFLRRSRLDELPQLINVIKGDMSFVGPRPERPYFVERLEKQIPYYMLRHTLKPGITGWAQIRYSYGASVEEALEKLQYDLFYIKNLSIWLDITIISETIKIVLLQKGSR